MFHFLLQPLNFFLNHHFSKIGDDIPGDTLDNFRGLFVHHLLNHLAESFFCDGR